MTLEQLRYFITVVEAQSISRAAEQLYISHSSISKSIKQIERELDCELLTRAGHSLACTAAGELLYTRGLAILTDWAELEKEIHLLGKRRKQELNILSVDFYVPQFHTICEKYKESHPDVTLNITFAQPQDFVSQMLTCHYDVGFSFSIEKTSKEAGILDFLPTESGHFFVVTSKKHPFASLESISAQELVNCLNAQPTKELRLIPQGTLVTYPFADIPQTQQDITLNNLHLMVKMGMWAVSLPEHVAYDFRNDCAVIPLESSASYEMGFYWIHGECTEQTNRFIFFVENFCKK